MSERRRGSEEDWDCYRKRARMGRQDHRGEDGVEKPTLDGMRTLYWTRC